MPSCVARAAIVASVLLAAAPSAAQDPSTAPPQTSPAGEELLTFRTSLKASGLFSRAPDDPFLFPEQNSATSFWRLRVEPKVRVGTKVIIDAAYEQRLRVHSGAAGLVGAGVLPPDTPAPYRVRQLDWQIALSPSYAWRHEIDRASLGLHLPGADVTVGRQAVGWGRGVLFGAVDLFSPFTPLEADREWRRGIDAVRADVKIADRLSLDGVGAFGGTFDTSAFALRLRGYAGKADVELVGGWRARDALAGVTSSAAVGDAEVHGELAVVRAPGPLPAGGLGSADRVAIKAVAGGSYRFGIGNGLVVYAEYHYSGFGARSPEAVLPLLANPDFRARYLRGDTQILGRHALAMLGTHEFSPELTAGVQWVHSPTDGSGLALPSTTVTLGDRLSVVGMVYLPYGRAPISGMLRSEYGGTPRTGFVQLRLYL